jgi:HAE1 family hydrophobic/amphiphilic exporter-1
MAQTVDKQYRKRGIEEIVEWLSQRTARIPGAEMISVSVSSGATGPGNNIQKEVQGQFLQDMALEAERVAEVMRKTPGAVDVDISYKPYRPERRIVVDRLRAAKMGLTVAQIATAARTAIDGDDSVKLRDSGTEYPIRVHYDQAERNTTSAVGNLIIGSRDGAPIYLRDVAEVKTDNAPTKIDRKNRQRVIYVTANLAKGAEMGNGNQAIESTLKKTPLVPGTSIATGGSTKMMAESFGYMLAAMVLAILLVYMLMGALFESFLTPFVIMFSLPQAMIGALLALLITGKSMSIVAMIGMIMLMGLVTKNAILLIDYTNTLMERGLKRHDALLEAGPTRLRPILMTTLAMVGGMIPTAIAINQGAEMRSPMAIALIGGLILSTLLTLIVIPVTYTAIDDVWKSVSRLFSPRSSKRNYDKDPDRTEELIGSKVE